MPITWKNIEAPDFATAQKSVALAGQQMDKAFNSARNVVGDFEDKRQQKIDLNTNAFLDEVRKTYRDPNELAAARESGALDQLRGQFQQGVLDPTQTGAANIDVMAGQLRQQHQAEIEYDNTLLKENSREHENAIADLLTARNYEGAREYANTHEMFDKAGQLRLIDEQYRTNTQFDKNMRRQNFDYKQDVRLENEAINQESTADALSLLQIQGTEAARVNDVDAIAAIRQELTSNPNFDDKQKAATDSVLVSLMDQAMTGNVADTRIKTIEQRDKKIQDYLGVRNEISDRYNLDWKQIESGSVEYLESLPYEARRAVESLQEERKRQGIDNYEDQNALMEADARDLMERRKISFTKAMEIVRPGYDNAYNTINQQNAQQTATYENQMSKIQQRLDKNVLYEKPMSVEERSESVLAATGYAKLEKLADEWFDNDGEQMEQLSAILGKGIEVEGTNGEMFNIPVTRTIAKALDSISTTGFFNKSPAEKLQQMIENKVITSADAEALQSDMRLMSDLQERTFRGNSESNLTPSLMSLPRMSREERALGQAAARQKLVTIAQETNAAVQMKQQEIQQQQQTIADLRRRAALVARDEDGVADKSYEPEFKELEQEQRAMEASLKTLLRESAAAQKKLEARN